MNTKANWNTMSVTRWHCGAHVSQLNRKSFPYTHLEIHIKFTSWQQSNFTYLHFLQGLHMDAAAFAMFYEGQVEGVHQDDSSQARGVSTLHIVQQHLSFVRLVTDDCGDFGWKDTSMHTHPCVSIIRIKTRQNKTKHFSFL